MRSNVQIHQASRKEYENIQGLLKGLTIGAGLNVIAGLAGIVASNVIDLETSSEAMKMVIHYSTPVTVIASLITLYSGFNYAAIETLNRERQQKSSLPLPSS